MKLISKNVIYKAIIAGHMKKKDQQLIKKFSGAFKPSKEEPISNSALFYPSAGLDLITPIILGLPYCIKYYFYEKEPKNLLNDKKLIECFFSTLNSILGIETDQNKWHVKKQERHFLFKHKGIRRTIHWVHKDNTDFLNRDVNLAFYFHRGDSYGEGGSGQFWDSELLPKLIKKVPDGGRCFFITDGEPRGLLPSVKDRAYLLTIHDGIEGNYYFGVLPDSTELT